MLSIYKLRRQLSKQKLSPCRQVLAMFGHLGCGIGLAAGMFGAQAFGFVRQLATALGIVGDGIKHQVAAGTTAADNGAKKIGAKFNLASGQSRRIFDLLLGHTLYLYLSKRGV